MCILNTLEFQHQIEDYPNMQAKRNEDRRNSNITYQAEMRTIMGNLLLSNKYCIDIIFVYSAVC